MRTALAHTVTSFVLSAMIALAMAGSPSIAQTTTPPSAKSKPPPAPGARKSPQSRPPSEAPAAQPVTPAPGAGTAATTTAPVAEKKPALPPETIEADVSTRSVAVTSGFTGIEIIVFGTVDNSRQESAEHGLYDVAVVVEGTAPPLIVRKKSNVAGIWINTQAMVFDNVPNYYAVASTRPIEEIAGEAILARHGIGFTNIPMMPAPGQRPVSKDELSEYRAAVVRLKSLESLYVEQTYNVAFIGRSLFRSSIDLPANVPVGSLVAHVYLFREGELLSKYTSKVKLEREGLERYLHNLAFRHPFFYGLLAVAIAMCTGLAASSIFRRGAH